jgi:6-pyruvoyltetrahydropterin/6-carboxytetrahydropterin synthase
LNRYVRRHPMPDSYHIRIEKKRLVFSAAHFITFGDDVCERLHGHNYHVAAEVHGPLEANAYVIDFIAVRDALQQIVDELDHRVLLPADHPTIKVTEQGAQIVVAHAERRWHFPVDDCLILPVPNTTAEMLARYIAGKLLLSLAGRTPTQPTRVVISVDECDGQWGVYDWAP